jgi:hypothetical protein
MTVLPRRDALYHRQGFKEIHPFRAESRANKDKELEAAAVFELIWLEEGLCSAAEGPSGPVSGLSHSSEIRALSPMPVFRAQNAGADESHAS